MKLSSFQVAIDQMSPDKQDKPSLLGHANNDGDFNQKTSELI